MFDWQKKDIVNMIAAILGIAKFNLEIINGTIPQSEQELKLYELCFNIESIKRDSDYIDEVQESVKNNKRLTSQERFEINQALKRRREAYSSSVKTALKQSTTKR
jgi:hypothetical protein